MSLSVKLLSNNHVPIYTMDIEKGTVLCNDSFLHNKNTAVLFHGYCCSSVRQRLTCLPDIIVLGPMQIKRFLQNPSSIVHARRYVTFSCTLWNQGQTSSKALLNYLNIKTFTFSYGLVT